MNNNKFIVSLHGASRNHNYGDVLLMAIYKSWIEEAGGEVIMDMANSYYGKYLNVEPRVSIKQAVNKAGFVIYGGGGYFGEPRNPSLRWRAKFVLHHMMPGILARMKGKPYGFFGSRFGPLNNSIIRKIGMYVINGAKVVSVRDNESRDYLLKYGYKKTIHVNPDSALSLADEGSRYHFKKEDKNAVKRIAFHLPLDPGKDFDKVRPHLVSFLKDLSTNKDYEYCFLVDHGLGQNCHQYKFFDSIRRELQLHWNIKEYSTPEDTLSFISSCDAILTTKLHIAITSYAVGVKPIGVSKHPKTKRFFRQVGLADSHFDLYDLLDISKRESIKEILFNGKEITTSNEIVERSLNNRLLLKAFLAK